GHDALFYRPGPMRIILQQFLIVIGFNHERVHLAQPLNQQFGWISQVGDKSEAAFCSVERIANRLDGIMRNRKSLDQNVANSEFRPSAEETPVAVFAQNLATDRFCRLRVAINWNGEFATENFQPANMIAMFMREQHAIELIWFETTLCQPHHDLARAQ